ncbi:MAG: small multi-drug export protein [Rhodopirellula sp.]|nr:small multi-drug export protein [Rhodopirellula sp.]
MTEPGQSFSENCDPAATKSTDLAKSLEHAEEQLWRRHRLLWWTTLLGPVAVTAGILLGINVFSGAEYTMRLLTTALTGVLLFGRFIILAGHDSEVAAVTGSLTSGQLFLMVTYLDLTVAILLIFHAGFLFRLPWFGSRAASLVEDGRFLIYSQPWIRRATFAGLVLFVAIPLAAMGSVGGTIFGRMLGVPRIRIFLAILVGSLLGNGVMWYGSDLINRFVDKHHPVVRFGGVILVLSLIALIDFLYRRTKRSNPLSPTA